MSTSNDRALVDTNVLAYAADTSSSFHEPSRQLRDQGFHGEVPLLVTPPGPYGILCGDYKPPTCHRLLLTRRGSCRGGEIYSRQPPPENLYLQPTALYPFCRD
jgi:hypothetical protein